MRKMVITIDGPAGSGKSTTARMVARRLGYLYLDTGAMYRAMTLKAMRSGIDPLDGDRLGRLARDTDIAVRADPGGTRIILDGNDVTDELRKRDVTRNASPVSAAAGVRKRMVELQRQLGGGGGIVAEGRDMGSVVFPDADTKIYLDAELRCRATRRRRELEEAGKPADLSQIESEIRDRDLYDSGREHSPLVVPSGATVIDTTNLTIDEQVERVLREVKKAAGEKGLEVPL
jgi:cytidylate kinase